MSITAMAGRTISVYRRTAFVVDASLAAASMDYDRAPAKAAFVVVSVSGGTDNTGTVTVHGTVSGAPDSETLTFTGAGFKQTTKLFDSLDASPTLTTTGLAGEATVPTVSAKAVGSNGHPHHAALLLVSGWPARFDKARGAWPNPVAGVAEIEKTRIYVDYTTTWSPREGDVLVDETSSEEFLVVGHPELHGGGSAIPHHWEFEVRRRNQSTTT